MNHGIHLCACLTSITYESWKNFNAINDCVKEILQLKNIFTFVAIGVNAASGKILQKKN